MAATSFDSGPFHGSNEGYAKLYLILSLVEAFSLLVFPWVVPILARHHHPGLSFAQLLPVAPGMLVLIDFLGLTLVLSFVSIHRRLSAKIAEAGPESAFLDKIRVGVLAFTQSAIMLLFVTAISIRR
jgi:hypothetical protein